MRATDIGEIAHEALARHTPQAQDYGVNLVVRVDGPSGAVADGGRALQALSNLVENAIRCTSDGGTVEIVATPGRLAVVDDGPGIEPEDLDRAFERFYLWERYGVDRPVDRVGLAIVAELATAMRGRVTATSTPGHGSVFALERSRRPRRTTALTHGLRSADARLTQGTRDANSAAIRSASCPPPLKEEQ